MIPLWWLAFVPAVLFVLAWIAMKGWRDPKPILAAAPPLAAGCWGLYALWEGYVVGPEDNIRVDLVLLGPFLIALTALAVVALVTLPRRLQTSTKSPA